MAALDNASQIKVSLIDDGQGLMAAPDDVAQVKVSLVGGGEQSIALVQSRGDGVALNGSAQPILALAVPGVQGPSGTAFEEIPLNKLAPGTLPSGVSLGNALTFDDEGGASPGGTFNGGSPRTISYTSVGAAAVGHTHANLIFVPAGASDTALAAAFTDAAANGKRIVFAENTTVRIPSLAPTIQAACTLVMPTVDVTVLIQSGYTINNVNELRNGDFSRFRITSEDATVLVGVSLPSDRGAVECHNATGPEWDIVLDCDAKADFGLALFNSRGSLNPGKGIKRSRLANAFVKESSNLNAPNAVGGIGAILSDGLQHGVWVTWSSSLSSLFLDLRNNGGGNPNANSGGFGAFVSRGCHVQLDFANMSGSWNGIRCARSIVSAREANYSNILRNAIVQFEEGFVNASLSNFNNSGSDEWSVLRLGIGNNGRAQGGGVINAESSTFNNCQGEIATVNGARGLINIDDCSGTGIERRVATVNNGSLSAIGVSFTASATNTQTEFFLASRNSTVTSFAGIYNGNSVVRNLGRVISNAVAVFDTCVSSAFIENVLCRVEDSGHVYAKGTTHNGSSNPMNRGGNANGELVRYQNGVQECWAWLEVTNIGSTKSMNRTWNFPAAFAEPLSTVVVTAMMSVRNPSNQQISSTRNKLKDAQLLSGAVSTAGTEFFVEINSSASTEFVTGDTCWIRAHAIGRWF